MDIINFPDYQFSGTSMKLILVCVSSAFFLFSCTNQKRSSQLSKIDSEILSSAYLELGSPLQLKESPKGSFTLCIKEDPEYGGRVLDFLVVDNDNGEIVVTKKRIRGKVEWDTERRLKILEFPGQVENRESTPADYTYYIDIEEKNEL